MADVVQSKLKTGTLKLGEPPVEFACQASNVTISSTYTESGDAIEVLCGDALGTEATVAKTLKVTAIQDFDDPTGFMRFLRAHELEVVPFQWQASPIAELASGQVQCRQGDWGGDVNRRLTTSPELPIVGEIVWTPAEPIPATGAIAGSPGVFTPTGAAAPANLAALQAGSVTATPATAWTTGQHVVLGDSAHAHWTATAWATGDAP